MNPTLAQWRSTPALTSSAKKLQADPAYAQMLSLAREHVRQISSLPRMGSSAEDHAYNYGMIIGYWHCLSVLDSMSELQVEPTDLVADFSDENNKPHPD